MPFNISRSADFPDKEILRFPTGLHAIKSVVLDGTDFVNTATVSNTRYFVPAGTVLTLSVTNTDKHVAFKGTGTVAGILARPVDILAQVTAGSEPAPMFYHECVFATSALVGFTQYASQIVNNLNTCKFE